MADGEKKGGEGSAGAEGAAAETVSKADFEALNARFTELQNQLGAKDTEITNLKKERDALVSKGAKGGDEESREREKQLIRDEFQGKLDDATRQLAAKDETITKLLIVDRAMTKLGSQFRDDLSDIAKDLIKNAFGWEGDLDKGGLFVKDEKGQPKFKAGTNQKMTPEDWIEELKQSRPSLFKPEVVPGSKQGGDKKQTGTSTGATRPPAGFENWSQEKRQEWFSQNREAAKAYMKEQGLVN